MAPGDYLNLPEHQPGITIDLIEIRQDSRWRGLGRRFTSLLKYNFPGATFYALSECDAFWEGLGWNAHQRRNAPTLGPRHQTLFSSERQNRC